MLRKTLPAIAALAVTLTGCSSGTAEVPSGSPVQTTVSPSAGLLLTDASVEDEGVAQGDDDEGLNVTDGEHVDVRLGWPVVIVSPA